MRRTIAIIIAVSLSLAACGGSHKPLSSAEQTQEKAAAQTFDAAVKRCLPAKDGAPDVLRLRSHAGRTQFVSCAVPQSKRVTFNSCMTKLVLSGLPTKSRLESGASACLAKVES